MGRFNVTAMRYMESEHFRVLLAIEMGMKNHEVVPLQLISAVANFHRGATFRLLGDLIKNKLVSYEHGKKFNGYRLNVSGYDYLALRALCAREVVGSVGNQIGVGKESDVFVGGDMSRNDLVLKFHRLGRTSFRKIKEKRDYHKKRHYCSWLYLSRIAALKEFTFLKALSDRKFPVPKAIDVCRHTVVMGLIDGLTLCHVDSLSNVEEVYDKLMSLIMRFARYGLIHGDFNEFNIMLTNDEEIIVIDFPQMVSIDHPNAEFYFDRDVQCVRDFFRRKFGFDSEDYPRFDEVERKHNLDIELEASGFTKEMQLDLNQAYDKGDFEAHEDDQSDDESEDEEGEEEVENDDQEYDQKELDDIKEEAEEQKEALKKESRFNEWLESAQNRLNEMAAADHIGDEIPELVSMNEEQMEKYRAAIEEAEQKLKDAKLSEEESDDELIPPNEENETTGKKGKRTGDFKPRGKVTEARSVYSTGSTIAPADIRKRLMQQKSRAKKEKLKVKGKECAVRRGRKDNVDLIKEYAGWAF
uniref:Non-specific serine/threonine protein kinase n=1 Tax=Panagrolaimus sp. JU765 TaxID=591449 RepID=A0AC34R215_9BILA